MVLKRKLAGEHPVEILVDEIAEKTNFPFANNWIELARGTATDARRTIGGGGGGSSNGGGNGDGGGNRERSTACKGTDGAAGSGSSPRLLSVNDQVGVLIDLATDPNILGRTWVGWESHV